MKGKIIVHHEYPPIPIRKWDWLAYHDGEEETGHYGWGATREEALADLDRLDQERAEVEAMDSDYE
jgi:hypothetical protein